MKKEEKRAATFDALTLSGMLVIPIFIVVLLQFYWWLDGCFLEYIFGRRFGKVEEWDIS